MTSGRFIFLTDTDTGTGATGNTSVTVSDYTVSALDEIVLNIILDALSH